MQYVIFLAILAGVLSQTSCKSALECFIKNKKVKNYTVIALADGNGNSSIQWVEYKYYFERVDLQSNISNNLLVGVLLQDDNEYDCRSKANSSEYEGYSIDVINWLQQSLNISVQYVHLNSTDAVEDSIASEEVDVAICHRNVETYSLEFTELYPTLKSRNLLVYKPSKLYFTKDIFILTFAGSLWLVFFILLLLLAICLRITTTKYSMIHPKYEAWTWVEITLWAIAAACQQGLSHTPCGFASCCIFLIGYLTAYLLYTGFAAAITSLLLQHDVYYKLDVTNLDKFHLVCLQHSSYNTRSLQENAKTTTHVRYLHDLFLHLDEDNTVGLAPEILINEFMAKNLQHHEIANYLTSRLPSLPYNRGFYLPRYSTWKKTINKQLLMMKESGLLQNMMKRHLNPVPVANLNSGYSSAGREHVGSAIFFWLAGVLVAVNILLAEVVLACYKRNRNHLGL